MLIFIWIIVIPFAIGMLCLGLFQRKFFNRYNKVFHPKDPISIADLAELHKKDFSNANKFLKNNFIQFWFLRGKLYFQKYEDAKLNNYAFLVRLTIICMVATMIIAFFIF